jgi:general L-amino acid transport system substrate-binding protein
MKILKTISLGVATLALASTMASADTFENTIKNGKLNCV